MRVLDRFKTRSLLAACLVFICTALFLIFEATANSSVLDVAITEQLEELELLGQRDGPPTALVVITEFADYECKYCRELHSTMGALRKRLGDTVAILHISSPASHVGMAFPAARSVACADRLNLYAPFADLLYSSQDTLRRVNMALLAYQAGVQDTVDFNKCINSSVTRSAIQRSAQIARQLGVLATPTLLVDGEFYVGAKSSAQLEEIVRRALKH